MATKERFIEFKKEDIYCPRCLSLLVYGEGTRRYQTLVEHVCSPNDPVSAKKYLICSNEKCPTRINDDFWDWYGSFYYSRNYDSDFFIEGCSNAVNSGARAFALDKVKTQIVFLHLIWFKAQIDITPKYDGPGLNIIGHKYKITASTRKGLKDGWTLYISGIHMLRFCLRQFNYAKEKYLDNPDNIYLLNDLIKEMDIDSWDKRWWKRLSHWYINKTNPVLKEVLLRIKNS